MPDPGIPFPTFLKKTPEYEREEFVAKFPEAALVLEIPRDPWKPGSGEEKAARQTAEYSRKQLQEYLGKGNLFLHWVTKSMRNALKGKITLGRGSTNDIFVPHTSVSKFHAFFAHDKDTFTYIITDVGSTNGTFYRNNNQKLEKNRPYPIRTQDTLRFGPVVRGTFFLPEEFYAYVTFERRKVRR